VAATDVKLDYILAQPRTFTGRGEFSRQLMIQASYDTEAMVRESLGAGHALAIDRQTFHGTGSGGQILGIYNTPDVLTVAMGSVEPTWIKITDMIGAVGDSNAKRGKLGFATTALMEARLMAKLKASAAGSDFIWVPTGETEGRIGGYRAIGSTQISKVLGSGGDEHGFIFGNWNDVIICGWGALEIIVDPFTKADKGMIAITSFQMADVVVRHGQSFCVGTAAKLA
jgi:HK97 family phage major capsid protein